MEQETKNQRIGDKEKSVRIQGVELGAAAIREFPVPKLAGMHDQGISSSRETAVTPYPT